MVNLPWVMRLGGTQFPARPWFCFYTELSESSSAFSVRNRSGGAVLLAATLLTAVLTYYVLVKWALRSFSPLGAVYAPERQIFLGHLLFGMFLARYPSFRDRLLPQIPLGSE